MWKLSKGGKGLDLVWKLREASRASRVVVWEMAKPCGGAGQTMCDAEGDLDLV